MKYPDNYVKFAPFTDRIEADIEAGNEIRYLFIGAPGTGKSMLAKLVMDTLVAKHKQDHGTNPDYVFTSASEHYRKYLSLNSSNFSDKNEAMDNLMKVLVSTYCVIDDLGNEIKSDAANNYIAELFSYQYDRLRAAKRKPINTIITSNFGSKDLIALYGERIIDRIYETYTIFQFNNDSFRKKMIKIIEN